MPTTSIIEPNNVKRSFQYDECVMASDGTRFYIKYLDTPAPKPTQDNGNRNTTVRITQANSQVNSIQNANKQPQQQQPQKTVQLTSVLFSCQQCKEKFNSQASLNSHMKVHKGAFVCGICQLKYTSRAALNFHIERSHKDFEGPVDCPCGKRFANKKYMKRHQKRRFETERVICGRSSSSSSSNGVPVAYKNL